MLELSSVCAGPAAKARSAAAPFTRRRHIRRQIRRSMQPVAARSVRGAEGEVRQWLETYLPELGAVTGVKGMGGSGWSSTAIYETSSGKRLFVKTAAGGDVSMFRGEAEGLRAMYATHAFRIPQVHHYGVLPSGAGSFIVMDYLQLGGRCDQAELGRALAAMHLAAPSDERAAGGQFGFTCDNTIGATPQPNGWMGNWVEFFRERRLKHMLGLAGSRNLDKLAAPVVDNLEVFFQGIEVRPSLLHGDLWSGNYAGVEGQPSIYDPACYYGHHEAEFGMSWCGGFSGAFWTAYHEVIPRAPGFEDRKNLYELYHILNHYVLFGGGYAGQAESLLRRLNQRL